MPTRKRSNLTQIDRGTPKRPVDYDRDLHGEPQEQVVNTRSIEFRTVPPTGVAKQRKGKK